MEKYILALDQGTTSSRAIIFDHAGTVVALAQQEFAQIYPQPGWVEHNPEEIWQSCVQVMQEALQKAKLQASQIAAIGITNQRETTILWDKTTGEPLGNAIVWQDRRTARACDELKQEGYTEFIQKKTGLILDAYFSASKAMWMLDNFPEARRKQKQGSLAFGTIDSWLIWNMTEGEAHVSDVTNASRTMLYNIHTLSWDQELLDIFGISREMLPEVKSSSEIYGYTDERLLGAKIPIAGLAGDQQAALFGQMCIEPGMVKNTYGTGCFMVLNTGTQVVSSQHNLLSTIAWQVGDEVNYALEGSIFVAGAVIQWLRDGLGIIPTAQASESLASSVEDNGGVYFVPALTGLGAPHWDQYARGTMVGITRGATAAHLARAALESIALQTADVLAAMQADTGLPIQQLRVDGGAVANNLLMQIQADFLDATVIRPKVLETTALGAAYLAGLAVGYWASIDEIRQQWQVDQVFSPQLATDKVSAIKTQWQKAVSKAKGWIDSPSF
ncbi:MAG: glycerol kinase GlpK [Microscillaceae bacterium]|jgi:glycerol kinase|nr:glycerol kinase GlpK [Microscillaceae bacterium]